MVYTPQVLYKLKNVMYDYLCTFMVQVNSYSQWLSAVEHVKVIQAL